MSGRYFDDVVVGEELPFLQFGPLTTAHLTRWSAATENWHKIHYDQKFATEHDGLPGLLVNGSLKQQFIVHQLRHWAGADGWIWKVGFQFRSMNVVGETLLVWARVVNKRKTPDFGLVDIVVGIRNEAGKESTPGQAVVALPFQGGAALPYPFVTPKLNEDRT